MAWAISSSLGGDGAPGVAEPPAGGVRDTASGDAGSVAAAPGVAGAPDGTLDPQPRAATARTHARTRVRIAAIMRPDREPAHV